MFNFIKPKLLDFFEAKLLKSFIWLFFAFLSLGLYFAIINSPADYQQGESVRIMYVHVPSAWMALLIYFFMATNAISFLVWKNPLSFIFARNSANIGTAFAFLALITGSIWGKPIWGVWWVWDSRLTSMLILFLIYIGAIYLYNSIAERFLDKAEKLFSIIVVIGLINLPIVKFSVDWWNTLHQKASIISSSGLKIDISMLIPLLLIFTSFLLYFIIALIISSRNWLNNKKIRNLINLNF